jgi:hypothetical protein
MEIVFHLSVLYNEQPKEVLPNSLSPKHPSQQGIDRIPVRCKHLRTL